MKTRTLATVLFCLLVATAGAAVSEPALRTVTSEARIVSRSENQRTWDRVQVITNMARRVLKVETVTNRYVELAPGICFEDAEGKWHDAEAEFTPALDGGAEALRLGHKVHLSPDLHTEGALQVRLPNGQLMS